MSRLDIGSMGFDAFGLDKPGKSYSRSASRRYRQALRSYGTGSGLGGGGGGVSSSYSSVHRPDFTVAR